MFRETETKEALQNYLNFEKDLIDSLYQIALSLAVIADSLDGGLITIPLEDNKDDEQ